MAQTSMTKGPETMGKVGEQAVTDEQQQARRAAAQWLVRLKDAPQDEVCEAQFDAWLAASPLHESAWQDMQQTVEVMRAAVVAELGVTDLAQARRQKATHGTGRRFVTLGAAAAAACVMLVAAPDMAGWAHREWASDFATGGGVMRTVHLEDGTKVHLGPESALRVNYSPSERQVELMAGQALFEVAKAPERPFRVHTRALTTTVLGTAFDVRLQDDDAYVGVQHGQVKVETVRAKTGANLSAGDWLSVSADGQVTQGQRAPELIGVWRQGDLLAREQTIEALVAEIRPWFRGQIILANKALGQQKITGTYNLENPVQALSLIVTPHAGNVRQITPWIIIII
ncbi:MAG: FecR domain-containing protein [Asticcacaulis sp.]